MTRYRNAGRSLCFFNSTTEHAPTVRAFTPKGHSSFLNSTSESVDEATFVMNAERRKQVVLLLDDGQGNQQTTDLLTVGGAESSSTGCIQNQDQIGGVSPSSKRPGLSKGSIIGIVVGSVSVVGGISILMGVFVYRQRRRRLGKVRKFTSLESEGGSGDAGENGQVPQMMNRSPSLVSQARHDADLPPLPRAPPNVPPVVTRFGTADVTPRMLRSPEFIGYRDRGSEPSPLLQRQSSQWSMVTVPVPGSTGGHREISKSPRLSPDQPDLDIDEILDLATMYGLSPTNDKFPPEPFTVVTANNRDRYRPPVDVPVGAEHMSAFFPSSVGSRTRLGTETRTASALASRRRVSGDSFVGGAQESGEASPNLDLTRRVEIATATRAGSAVARVALVDSQTIGRDGVRPEDRF